MSNSPKRLLRPRPSGRYTAPMPISSIAIILGIHRTTASDWLKSGKLVARKIGGLWRLHEDELPVELPPPKPKTVAKCKI